MLSPLRSGEAQVTGFIVERTRMRRGEKVGNRSGAPYFSIKGKAVEDVLLGVESGEHIGFADLLFGGEPFGIVGFVRDEPGGHEMAGSGVIKRSLLSTLPHRHLTSQSASVVIRMASFISVGKDGVDAIQATSDLLGDRRQVSSGFLIRNGQHLALRFTDTGQRDGTQHLLAAMRGIVFTCREADAGEVPGIAGAGVRDVKNTTAWAQPGAGSDHLVIIMSYYD